MFSDSLAQRLLGQAELPFTLRDFRQANARQ